MWVSRNAYDQLGQGSVRTGDLQRRALSLRHRHGAAL